MRPAVLMPHVLRLLLIFIAAFHIPLGAQSGYEWGSVAIGGGGFVSGIITCPYEKDLIYARTDVGGAYRWNETDRSWIPLADWVSADETSYLGVESIAVDPRSPNRVYMLAGTEY